MRKKIIGFLLLMFKGFLMGISNLIPGVSGGTVAMILGIYERLIGSISHFFGRLKENLGFLIPLLVGMIVCFLSMSGVIKAAFASFPLPTVLFFIGLIIGGIPMTVNKIDNKKTQAGKVSNWIILLAAAALVTAMTLLKGVVSSGGDGTEGFSLLNTLLLLPMGAVVAATMVIPGISGSLLLMLFGQYDTVIGALSNLGKLRDIPLSLLITVIYGLGLLVGIVCAARLIELLLRRFPAKTYFGVLGFLLASVFAIPAASGVTDSLSSVDGVQIAVGIALLFAGAGLTYFINKAK